MLREKASIVTEGMRCNSVIKFEEWSKAKEENPNPGAHVWVSIKDEAGFEVEKRYLGHNSIVQGMGVLLARLTKDSQEPTSGFSFLAVGTGPIGGNPMSPPPPVFTNTLLHNELGRKTFSNSYFVDPNGLPVVGPTNIVDFETIFGIGEAVGPIVELGIFGGDATVAPNSGTMVNHITFPVVSKSASMSVTFLLRFAF